MELDAFTLALMKKIAIKYGEASSSTGEISESKLQDSIKTYLQSSELDTLSTESKIIVEAINELNEKNNTKVGTLLINITQDSDKKLTSDKTYQEIIEAIHNNINPMLEVFESDCYNTYPLSEFNTQMCTFANIQVSDTTYQIIKYYIYSNGDIQKSITNYDYIPKINNSYYFSYPNTIESFIGEIFYFNQNISTLTISFAPEINIEFDITSFGHFIFVKSATVTSSVKTCELLALDNQKRAVLTYNESNPSIKITDLNSSNLITEIDLNQIQQNKNDIVTLQDEVGQDAPGIQESAQGRTILLRNSSDKKFKGLRQYGYTIQNGTPTPENPQELVSAGDKGNIEVDVFGGNLLDINTVFNGIAKYGVSVNVNDKQQVVYEGTVTHGNATIVQQDITDIVKKEGKVYCFYNLVSGTFQHSIRVNTYDSDNTVLKRQEFPVPLEYEEGKRYILYVISVQNGEIMDFNCTMEIQINASSTPLPWEPYKKQSLICTTPNGLPGIPVSSGGNYTDENGQQWICDEVDFGRGVYVQRIGQIESYTNEDIAKQYMSTTGELTVGAKVYYTLDTPIETPIPADELAAYRALHTIYPTTTIINSADCWTEMDYVVDTELYIEQLKIPQRIEKTSVDTSAELQPNILHVFPEMTELTLTFAIPTDTTIANEYHCVFTSGATATTLTLPDTIKIPDGFTVEANKIYELSVLEGCLSYMSWDYTAEVTA